MLETTQPSILGDPLLFKEKRSQRTLAIPFTVEGRGLFTGSEALLTVKPAPADFGIQFLRTDLKNSLPIKAIAENVIPMPRCTRIGKDGSTVQTIEHLMAALYCFGVDNALIEVSGPEIPICDGSSCEFVEKIFESGLEDQQVVKKELIVTEPLYYEDAHSTLIALPSNTFSVSYLLDFAEDPLIGTQYYATEVNRATFINQIAACRTFASYAEIEPLIQKGLLKEASLENGIVVRDGVVMNPEGLRYENEMARHKVLDLIGDLSLAGGRIRGRIVALKSGHAANTAFAHKLAQAFLNGE